MSEKPGIRIYISSPSDVRPEQLIAERIVARLDREFAYHFQVEAVLWEREPLVAAHHFQDPHNMPAPRSADIVVVILWWRLSVPLPEKEFRGALLGRIGLEAAESGSTSARGTLRHDRVVPGSPAQGRDPLSR
jgi:hypothetical protein